MCVTPGTSHKKTRWENFTRNAATCGGRPVPQRHTADRGPCLLARPRSPACSDPRRPRVPSGAVSSVAGPQDEPPLREHLQAQEAPSSRDGPLRPPTLWCPGRPTRPWTARGQMGALAPQVSSVTAVSPLPRLCGPGPRTCPRRRDRRRRGPCRWTAHPGRSSETRSFWRRDSLRGTKQSERSCQSPRGPRGEADAAAMGETPGGARVGAHGWGRHGRPAGAVLPSARHTRVSCRRPQARGSCRSRCPMGAGFPDPTHSSEGHWGCSRGPSGEGAELQPPGGADDGLPRAARHQDSAAPQRQGLSPAVPREEVGDASLRVCRGRRSGTRGLPGRPWAPALRGVVASSGRPGPRRSGAQCVVTNDTRSS